MPVPRGTTDWRHLALERQGLGARPAFGQGIEGTLRAIAHLGYVQIDTLSVVERAHHHVLWSRVPGYAPEHLNQLAAAGQIFEYWFHAAAYLPMQDYRFALPRMQSFRRGESPYFRSVDARLMAEILARVRGEGVLRSRDLQERSQGDWWNHGPGRRALDKLFMQGDLMVRERQGMEKRYVLPAQLLPAGLDLREPTPEDMAAHLLDNALRAHGVVTWKQLLHLRTGQPLRQAMRALLQARLEQGALVRLGDAAPPETYAVAPGAPGAQDRRLAAGRQRPGASAFTVRQRRHPPRTPGAALRLRLPARKLYAGRPAPIRLLLPAHALARAVCGAHRLQGRSRRPALRGAAPALGARHPARCAPAPGAGDGHRAAGPLLRLHAVA